MKIESGNEGSGMSKEEPTQTEKEKKIYFDHMKSEYWKKLRKKILEENNYECCICGLRSIHNHVHHESYDNMGKEKEARDCIVLCEKHHKGIHNSLNYLKKGRKVVLKNEHTTRNR